jgi:hypothetical protein
MEKVLWLFLGATIQIERNHTYIGSRERSYLLRRLTNVSRIIYIISLTEIFLMTLVYACTISKQRESRILLYSLLLSCGVNFLQSSL